MVITIETVAIAGGLPCARPTNRSCVSPPFSLSASASVSSPSPSPSSPPSPLSWDVHA
jgi:hypothetical protein